MEIVPAELGIIGDVLADTAREIIETWEDIGPPAADPENNPALLAEAAARLTDVLKRVEMDSLSRLDTGTQASALTEDPAALSGVDISELGDYGLTVISGLGTIAAELGLVHCQQTVTALALPFALWIARHDGELQTLEDVTNTVAQLANSLQDPVRLEELCVEVSEILDAVSDDIRQDLDNSNPGRPWRILNINHSIIATRTNNPQTMEATFELLIENLPDDAPNFFREGMGQMDIVGYPPRVREVMQRYYDRYFDRRKLH